MTPKFKIGDKVTMRSKSLYGETEGVITEIDRTFQEIDQHTGKINKRGLMTFEHTIKSCQLPYDFDGTTLKVHFPQYDYGTWIQKARTEISIFAFYSYTVKTEKMLCMYPERSLTIKK